jgi:hypothetical protein
MGVSAALLAQVGDDGAAQLAVAIDELHRLERAAHRAAIDGDQWRTLWGAQGTRHGC